MREVYFTTLCLENKFMNMIIQTKKENYLYFLIPMTICVFEGEKEMSEGYVL